MGALTENHRCPVGRRFGRITRLLTNVVIGAVAGGLFVFAIEDRPAGALILTSAALGAVLTSAVRQAIGGPKF
jgi:hypothetical protein